MSKRYIIAIDQGTSSTKALLFDEEGVAVAKGAVALETHYLDGGRVEQDPEAIYQNVLDAVAECLKVYEADGGDKAHIVACGISNQRETFILWDQTGVPLHRAVVWQCKRSIPVCERLDAEGYAERISAKTGLIIDPYFSGSKVIWLYENDSKVKAAIDSGRAYFGTVDTWLLYCMTGGRSYYTDYTNASRTLFYNLHELDWDRELLHDFGLSGLRLPKLRPSAAHYGQTDIGGLLPAEISISAMIGDSHAAAFGEGCYEPGSAKATLGTGCSILMNVGDQPKLSDNGMISTICWSMERRVDYALEGIIVSAGATIEWVKKQLGLFHSITELESICTRLEDNGGVYVIPAFSGLGAPHWDMTRKASIEGLTFDSTADHVIRAAVESVPYQIRDIISAMEVDASTPLHDLKVDGGITQNGFVMQYLADLLEREVRTIDISDVSAMGAAYLAGLQIGLYRDLDQLKTFHQELQVTVPSISVSTVQTAYADWCKYLRR